MIVSHQFAKLLVYIIAFLFCFVSSKKLYAMSWLLRGNDFGMHVRELQLLLLHMCLPFSGTNNHKWNKKQIKQFFCLWIFFFGHVWWCDSCDNLFKWIYQLQLFESSCIIMRGSEELYAKFTFRYNNFSKKITR